MTTSAYLPSYRSFADQDLSVHHNRSAALDSIGRTLSDEGFRPVEYRMNVSMNATLAAGLFKGLAGTLFLDGEGPSTSNVAAGFVGVYIDGASGGVSVQIAVDPTLDDGIVVAKVALAKATK